MTSKKQSSLDSHGQPANNFFNLVRTQDRSMSELLGLCHGMLADGTICQKEAEYLQLWLQKNQHIVLHSASRTSNTAVV